MQRSLNRAHLGVGPRCFWPAFNRGARLLGFTTHTDKRLLGHCYFGGPFSCILLFEFYNFGKFRHTGKNLTETLVLALKLKHVNWSRLLKKWVNRLTVYVKQKPLVSVTIHRSPCRDHLSNKKRLTQFCKRSLKKTYLPPVAVHPRP